MLISARENGDLGKGNNPMDETAITPRPGRWYFGDEWPGIRCGARTRAGTPCRKAALSGKTRCRNHGGLAGAPCGARNGNYKNGRWTKEAIAMRRGARGRIKA